VPTARRQATEVARLKADGVKPSEIAVRLGIGRASVYRVLGDGTDGVPAAARAGTINQNRGFIMSIGSALERGSLICFYDEQGRTPFSKARGSGPNDGLLGFAGSTVSARYGSVIYTYDEHGMTIYSKAARQVA
jgi:hypothetical protein